VIRNVKDLRHVAVDAVDGRVGFVEQVFFDDERWTIRYLVVDTGPDFEDRRVLLSPMVVTGQQDAEGVVKVNLTCRQVAYSPPIDTEKPVSRQNELELNRYFVLPSYWGGMGLWGARTLPAELVAMPPEQQQDAGADVHLRSSREVIGYRVKAADGRIGHVEDFLYQDDSWHIRYLEVDTRNWIGGHHVLVSPRWVASISWDARTLSLDLPVGMVREAPEYHGREDLTPEYERALHAHYHRNPDEPTA
jgi:uncharacterized protein YrrD